MSTNGTGRCARNPHVRCAACEHRGFLPLDDGVVMWHFKGKAMDISDVVGLYPMVDEDHAWVLVVDFDKGAWRDEVAACRAACDEAKIPVAVERSRSGFARWLVPRFTTVRIQDEEGAPLADYGAALAVVSAHEGRNQLILDDVHAALQEGRTPLVLTRLVEHAWRGCVGTT